jgi:hypothetical protein
MVFFFFGWGKKPLRLLVLLAIDFALCNYVLAPAGVAVGSQVLITFALTFALGLVWEWVVLWYGTPLPVEPPPSEPPIQGETLAETRAGARAKPEADAQRRRDESVTLGRDSGAPPRAAVARRAADRAGVSGIEPDAGVPQRTRRKARGRGPLS